MLLRRIASAHEHHQRIARGAFVAGIFVMLAKLGAVAREVAIAWGYGTSSIVDAFQISFNVVTWLPVVLAGTSTALLVPRLVSVRTRQDEGDRFVTELNGAVVATGIAVLICTALAAFPAVELIGKGLAPPVLHLAVRFTFVMLPVSFLTIVVALLYVRLQAREQQAFAVTEAIPPLCVAVLVLLLARNHTASPLLIGSVGGLLLQAIVLAALIRRDPEGVGGFSLKRTSPEWLNIYRHLLLMAGAQALVGLSLPLDNAFASRGSAGAIATYGYAARLLGVFISFGGVIFSRAILPVLSELASKREYAFGSRVAAKWSWLLLLLGAAGAAVAWVLTPFMVRIAFQRGAFTAADTAAVSNVVRFGLAQLPFSFAALPVVQWFAAKRQYGVIFLSAAAAGLTKIVLNNVLFKTLGLPGLALATAGMYAISFVVMLALSYRGSTAALPRLTGLGRLLNGANEAKQRDSDGGRTTKL